MVKNKYLKFSYLLAFVAIVFLNSCGTTNNNQALFNSVNEYDIANLNDIYVVNDKGVDDIYYKIKVNDEITIRNLQNPEWGATKSSSVVGAGIASTDPSQANAQSSITYRIDDDGMANLPAIGKVLLAGLTRKEATQKLQDSYGNPKYLINNPIIDLRVVNLQVTMLGEFNKQANFKLEKDNTHLFEMIGEAGGLTKTADPKTLKIIRGNKANPEVIYVNLQNQKSLANRKLILQNGDLILIDKTKSAQIADNLQKSNNIIQPLLVVVNLAILIFTLTK